VERKVIVQPVTGFRNISFLGKVADQSRFSERQQEVPSLRPVRSISDKSECAAIT